MARPSPASAEALRLYRPSEHAPLVEDGWDEGKVRRAIAAIVDEAERARDGRFWPDHPSDEWPAFPPGPIRVQWCHGAPGMVATVGDLMPLELARSGAELTWRAGPLAKGVGRLCHGTAGNGYAFLKLFALTGDELWRERARCFAMHTIARADRERAALGRGRYTIWTGDVGVALYLQSCLDDDARVPTVDVW